MQIKKDRKIINNPEISQDKDFFTYNIKDNNKYKTPEKHKQDQTQDNEDQKKQLCGPINDTQSDQDDIELTNKLINILNDQGQVISEDEISLKYKVISELQSLVYKWTKSQAMKMGYNDCYGKVITFGSFQLKIYDPNSDIDALCVCSKIISRESFNRDLQDILSKDDRIKQLTLVDAKVPLIKMKFNDISIDLLFARFPYDDVNLEKLDEYVLSNFETPDILSINGRLMNDKILNNIGNTDTYRLTLKIIKQWARRRGIYDNKLGYLGGVSWAILVAKISQFYPNKSASYLVAKFFEIFSNWDWSQTKPVFISEIDKTPIYWKNELKVWNPEENAFDKQQCMPILTPSFPCMNTSYNVSEHISLIIQNELKLGHEKIISNSWEKLFEDGSMDFFSNQHQFVKLHIAAKNEEDMQNWLGQVESLLRKNLFHELYEQVNMYNHEIRPQPKLFKCQSNNQNNNLCYFIGIKMLKSQSKQINNNILDLQPTIQQFMKQLDQASFRNKKTMNCYLQFYNRQELPDYLFGGKENRPPCAVKKR